MLDRGDRIAGARIIALDLGYRPAARRHRLAQRLGHQAAILGARHQRGETIEPAFAGKADLADDLRAR